MIGTLQETREILSAPACNREVINRQEQCKNALPSAETTQFMETVLEAPRCAIHNALCCACNLEQHRVRALLVHCLCNLPGLAQWLRRLKEFLAWRQNLLIHSSQSRPLWLNHSLHGSGPTAELLYRLHNSFVGC